MRAGRGRQRRNAVRRSELRQLRRIRRIDPCVRRRQRRVGRRRSDRDDAAAAFRRQHEVADVGRARRQQNRVAGVRVVQRGLEIAAGGDVDQARLHYGSRRCDRDCRHVEPSRVEHQLHDLRACGQCCRHRNVRIRLPATGRRHGDPSRARSVEARVQGTARPHRRDAKLHVVVSGCCDRHGVREPLAVGNPADVVTAFAAHFDVDVTGSVLAAAVAGCRIVVRKALASIVEIFRVDRTRQRPRRSAVRCAARLNGGEAEPVHVADRIRAARVEHDAHRLLPGGERHGFRNGRPVLPAPCVGNRQRPCDVHARKLHVERTRRHGGNARFEQIIPGGGDLDGVGEPLAG